MNLIQRIKHFGTAVRGAFSVSESTGAEDQPNWFRDKLSGFWFGLASAWTKSKQMVNHETAMKVATVFQCVRLIAEEGSMLPLKWYDAFEDGSRSPSHGSVPQRLLENPNPWQTPMEFKEFMLGCLVLRGNAYAQIVPGRTMLIPLHPSRVTPELLDDGRVVYHVKDRNGKTGTLEQFEMLHYKLLSIDGVVGLSPIEQCAELIGMDMAAVEHGATYFGNAAKPGGFISCKTPLTEEGFKQLAADVAQFRKAENRHKTPLFTADLEWNSTTMSNKDTQWLDSRKFTRAEIAAIFRVPLHMINDLDGAKFNNMELQDLALLKHTLMPYLVRIEQRIKHTLIYEDLAEEQTLFCKFNAEGLLRGDSKSRSEVNRASLGGPGIGPGWKSINDIRDQEDLPRIDDPRADTIYLGEPIEQPSGDGGDTGPSESETQAAMLKQQMELYGVGVRTGSVTPQKDDEDHFRTVLELPAAGTDVAAVWSNEPTRRPVTLSAPKDNPGLNDDLTDLGDDDPPEPPTPPTTPTPPADGDDPEEGDDPDAIAFLGPLEAMISDVAGRLLRIEERNVSRRSKYAVSDPDRFREWSEGFYGKHQVLAQRELRYLAEAAKCSEALEHLASNYCIGRCDSVLHDVTSAFAIEDASDLLKKELQYWSQKQLTTAKAA